MVSSGQVLSDLSSIKSLLSQYSSFTGELSSSWKGDSYDNFSRVTEEFYSDFSSSLDGQMNSFANACDLYEQYKTAKQNKAIAQTNYNNAVASNDNSSAYGYSNDITKYQNEMNDLKSQIENLLSSVCSIKLEASSINANISGSSTSNYSLGSTVANNMLNVALAEIGNSDGNGSHHKYEAANGLDDSQPWCAAFVSWVADQNNISSDVFPRFVGCTTGLGQFRDAGATIHYEGDGYDPQAGDLVFYSWSCDPNDLDHVGIVKSCDSNNLYAVEGNTSAEGEAANLSSGGNCVSEKTRSRTDGKIIAYVTPNY